jgi:hypothetical protein
MKNFLMNLTRDLVSGCPRPRKKGGDAVGFLRYFRPPSELVRPVNLSVQKKQAAIELIDSSISDRSLQAGNTIPNFVLPNAVNKSFVNDYSQRQDPEEIINI